MFYVFVDLLTSLDYHHYGASLGSGPARTTGQHNIRPMARTLDAPLYGAYVHGDDFITLNGFRGLK